MDLLLDTLALAAREATQHVVRRDEEILTPQLQLEIQIHTTIITHILQEVIIIDRLTKVHQDRITTILPQEATVEVLTLLQEAVVAVVLEVVAVVQPEVEDQHAQTILAVDNLTRY